jgi:hypothetical protein
MGVSDQHHALQTRAYPLNRKHKGHSGDDQKITLEVLMAFTATSTSFLERNDV